MFIELTKPFLSSFLLSRERSLSVAASSEGNNDITYMVQKEKPHQFGTFVEIENQRQSLYKLNLCVPLALAHLQADQNQRNRGY